MKKTASDTRTAILAAAATEFAAHGFAGASVDDIAARARFNKAMIYYHFENKLALYVEILRDVFRSLGARTAGIAASDATPADKVGGFLAAFNDMAASHPYMPPIMMREMAEGAVRLDAETLTLMSRIFGNLSRILQEGTAQGDFRPANPLLTYFSLVTPVIFFHASAPIRAALDRQQLVPVSQIGTAAFLAHQQSVVLAALSPRTDRPSREGRPSRKSNAPIVHPGPHPSAAASRTHEAGAKPKAQVTRKTSKRTRSSRSGDHA